MRVHPHSSYIARKFRLPLPRFSKVTRYEESRLLFRPSGNIKSSRVGGIDRHRVNLSDRVRFRQDDFIGMVGAHLHSLYGRGRRRNQVPTLSAVDTTPETCGMCIHRLGIERIKNKKVYDAAQVEHPPGSPAVLSDVRTTHVTRN